MFGLPKRAYTQAIKPDTTALTTDTLRVAARKGGVETTINYSARDSIRFDVVNKIMYLFGDSKIDYGTTSLTAEQIQINWETSTLTANGVPDSTGKLTGNPFFVDGTEQYQAEKIAYNYKTKRGKISGAITKQGEGFIHAQEVKKNADNELFGRNAQYTTCDLEHPHFFINTSKMKVEPGKKVITGPFNLWVGDIPTPIGFLFGLFPSPKKRGSGIIIPTFGETRDRGFYLRNGGYYWAVNDYIGMRFTGDIYSLGGYGLAVQSDYFKRYRYQGNFSLEHTYYPEPEQLQEGSATVGPGQFFRPERRSYWVRWGHNPVARPGAGRFTANVNAGTESYNRINATDIGQYLSSTFQSTIRYSRTLPNAPINYDITASQTQNIQTGIMTFNLPDISVGTNSLYPFRGLTELPRGAWYEDITNQVYFTYRLDIRNQFTNVINRDTLSFGRDFSRIIENGQNGARHNFIVSLGSYKLLKYLNFSPTVAYNEAWLLKRQEYRFTDTLEVETEKGFNRVYDYSAGATLSTQIYGMYNFRGEKLKAIRHVVNPSVSYRYNPNFRSPGFDFYQWVQTNPNGKYELLSRYRGYVYDASGASRQSALEFSLRNSLEMKVKSDRDTISGFEKIKLIDNLAATTSYNFAADSFKLSDLRLSLNTNLFNRISVYMTANFSPYQYFNGRQINELQANLGGFKLARFTDATLDLSTDLNPDNWKRQKRESANAYPVGPNPTSTNFGEISNLPEYVDFDVKWTLWLGYNTSYFNPRYYPETQTRNQNLTFRGSLNPTEKWKIQFTSGYDLANENVTVTSIDIYRDLHCWEMSIGWRPFGLSQGYFVNINVKSAMLSDLKLSRNRTYYNR